MPEIPVGEGVRADLEPDNDGVDFANGANQGMVDMIIHSDAGDEERKGGIDTVGPGDLAPGTPEGLSGLGVMIVLKASIFAFQAAEDTFCLLSSG